jgi:hypothetical protein
MAAMGEVLYGNDLKGLGNTLNESTGKLQRFDDGRYLYKFSTDKFDVDKFNREFEQYIDKRKVYRDEEQKKMLEELNKPKPVIPLYDLPMGQIMINAKDSVLNTLDDVINGSFDRNTFIKENRLFYLGIVLLFISILVYFYNMIVGSFDKKEKLDSIQIVFNKDQIKKLIN